MKLGDGKTLYSIAIRRFSLFLKPERRRNRHFSSFIVKPEPPFNHHNIILKNLGGIDFKISCEYHNSKIKANTLDLSNNHHSTTFGWNMSDILYHSYKGCKYLLLYHRRGIFLSSTFKESRTISCFSSKFLIQTASIVMQ